MDFGRWQVRSVLNEDRSVFVCVGDSGMEVVVKIPRRESLTIGYRVDADNREALAYEAQQLAAWRGIPGIVELIEWVPNAHTPFLVTERLGATLESEIPDEGLQAAECFELIRGLATTLERIHALRSAHHDVKPDNILRHPDGGWSLIDPSPAYMASDDYGPSHLTGAPRDLVALSRVFITAYTGSFETELPDEVVDSVLDLPEGDRWLKTLRKLERGGASATDARRAASAVLRNL